MNWNEADKNKYIPLSESLAELQRMKGWKWVNDKFRTDIERLIDSNCDPDINDIKQIMFLKGQLKYARDFLKEIDRIHDISKKMKEE